jgi:predicted  nucleic acid-binding Zn-ribbon protein
MDQETKEYIDKHFNNSIVALREEIGSAVARGGDRTNSRTESMERRLESRIERVERLISGITRPLVALEVRVSGVGSRLGQLEGSLGALDSDVSKIKTAVLEIEQAIKEWLENPEKNHQDVKTTIGSLLKFSPERPAA